MKILLLDIETSPHTGYFWGIWNQNIGTNMIKETGSVLCWAAKWVGEREIYSASLHTSTKRAMLKAIHKLLNEADAVIHYNGNKFDIPILNREFLLENLQPPAPAKQIDVLTVCRKRFKFVSNRLDYVAQKLGLGKKNKTDFNLWIRCMNGDPKAWKRMINYNKQDIKLLERVYERVKPWIKGHANYSLYNTNSMCCPNCGSTSLQRRGYAFTQAAKYARLQCKDCGSWSRTGTSVAPKPKDKVVGI